MIGLWQCIRLAGGCSPGEPRPRVPYWDKAIASRSESWAPFVGKGGQATIRDEAGQEVAAASLLAVTDAAAVIAAHKAV